MAVDKAVDSGLLDAGLTAVADAIRAKSGDDAVMSFPAGFVSAIGGLLGPKLLESNMIPPDAVWSPGYVSGTGAIAAASATTKEKYTTITSDDLAGRSVLLLALVSAASQPWVGIGSYKADGTYISRSASNLNTFPISVGSMLGLVAFACTLSAEAQMVKPSFRTYGTCLVGVYDISALADALTECGVMKEVQA